MLTIVKRHANIMRCLAAATCCEQRLFSAGESNLQNGFHSSGKSSLLINSSSKVERKEKNKCLNSRIGFHLVPKGTAESVGFFVHTGKQGASMMHHLAQLPDLMILLVPRLLQRGEPGMETWHES